MLLNYGFSAFGDMLSHRVIGSRSFWTVWWNHLKDTRRILLGHVDP
jgi:hypothetical protein